MRERARQVLVAFLFVAVMSGGSSEAAQLHARPKRAASPRKVSASFRRASPVVKASPVVARSPQETLRQIQGKLNARRKRLAQITAQEHHVLAQLTWTQEQLARTDVNLREAASALAGARQAVGRAAGALEFVTRRLAAHEAAMNARIRTFYEHGPLSYLDVILGAADFRDFVMRSYLVGRIMEGDLHLYRQVAEERRQKDEVRADLEARKNQLADQQQRWIITRDAHARLVAEDRRLLQHVRLQRRAQEEAIRELEAESARITAIILKSASGGHRGPVPTLRKGTLLWPALGEITSGYGWRIHPIFRSREFHTGIDIAAPWGTAVQAAADGTVLFTGWMRGYGMLVILDHGNGLSTTYSHLSSYAVHVGDHVQKGEVIARIGSTGWSTGPHLFFEVREDGQPVDPLAP